MKHFTIVCFDRERLDLVFIDIIQRAYLRHKRCQKFSKRSV